MWSVPNSTDLKVLNEYLGREVSWWWNYPCNDVDVTKIFVADTYTNFADETHIHYDGELEKDLSLKTIIINPMQQGELSKISLFGIGNYTWNMDKFNSVESWKSSLDAILGKEKAHSFEKLVPYLRYYDSLSPLAAIINEFKVQYKNNSSAENTHNLISELKDIVSACNTLQALKESESVSDSLFYEDLRPWLLKVKNMSENAIDMVTALTGNNISDFGAIKFAKCWSAIEGTDKKEEHRFDILRGMGTDITLSVQTAEPAAQSLRPFLNWLLEELEKKFKK